jgi:glycerophosphoryl diester phosphodiesterase
LRRASDKSSNAKSRINVIAHRGSAAYRPENTLAAFRNAIALGADYFELDCTLTKDGEVIVIHDDTLARTTGGAPGNVHDFTLAELKKYDIGSWFDPTYSAERFPTLGEALDLAKDKIGVYIEVKNSDNDEGLLRTILADFPPDQTLFPKHAAEISRRIEHSRSLNAILARKVIEVVRAHGMQKRVVVMSFSPIVCAVTLLEAPDLRTELLACHNDKDPAQWSHYLAWERLLDAPGFNPGLDDVTEALVQNLHARGKTIAVWTANEPEDMARLVRWGVDSLISDKPDIAIKMVQELL